MKFLLLLLVFGSSAIRLFSQPLSAPYTFSFPAEVVIDQSAFNPAAPAIREGDRLSVNTEGHFVRKDGSRVRLAGVSLSLYSAFPDSLSSIALANRLRALGVNCVRFTGIDYTYARTASLFADGSSTLKPGLDPEQMKKFDQLVYQLQQNGIYFTIDFHNYWNPRPEDDIHRWDSTGWGARMPLFFDEGIQKIHREVIRAFMTHLNPYTGNTYAEEPALAYVTVAEDGSLTAYWAYTQEVVRPARYGTPSSGNMYIQLIDSLFQDFLMTDRGLNTDQRLNAAWSTQPQSPYNQLSNGGFEDPFSTAWALQINTADGAKAILQTTESDKKEGTSSGRIRIGEIDANPYSIYLAQLLPNIKHLRRYTLSFWAKSSVAREIGLLVYNATFPYQSYGLQTPVSLTTDWKKYDLTFTSQVTDTATAAVIFVMGNAVSDIYLDDVQFKEVGYPGLTAGESISNGTVRRSEFFNDMISPARAQDEAGFYQLRMRQFYSNVYNMVRDTLKSSVLLCPSNRLLSAFDNQTAAQYEVFASQERRTNAESMLSDIYGGTIVSHAHMRFAGKAFVISNQSIDFPRQYQNEMGVIFPAYAGLQDWDGVFFGVWDAQGRMGSNRIDSNNIYEIFDKPNVLALLPSATAAVRHHAIAPSSRVVEISNNDEALHYPRLHSLNPYSLSLYVDPRLPVFRRVHTLVDLADEESFLPHLEVSAIANGVDPSALNAENEQIFWDASKSLFRVVTPSYVAVTGATAGQIVTLPGIIVENASSAEPATVTLSTLSAQPLTESTTSLLTVSTRVLNQGAEWNAQNTELARWGRGPAELAGADVRVTISASAMDSLHVQPLGNDGRPKGTRFAVAKSPTGRFSIAVKTNEHGTPWYRLEWVKTTSSVAEAGSQSEAGSDDRTVTESVTMSEAISVLSTADHVVVSDLLGGIVAISDGPLQAAALESLPRGVYVMRVENGGQFRTLKVLH